MVNSSILGQILNSTKTQMFVCLFAYLFLWDAQIRKKQKIANYKFMKTKMFVCAHANTYTYFKDLYYHFTSGWNEICNSGPAHVTL